MKWNYNYGDRLLKAFNISDVGAHLSGQNNELVKVTSVLERYGDFASFLDQTNNEDNEKNGIFRKLRQSETTGRPLGNNRWVEKLEK